MCVLVCVSACSPQDDCLDSGTGAGGEVFVSHSILTHALHECVALSCVEEGGSTEEGQADTDTHTPKRVWVRHSLLSYCQQGMEVGFSNAGLRVCVSECIIAGCGIGVRYGDGYGWPAAGFGSVSHSVFWGNGRDWANMRAGGRGDPFPGHRLLLRQCVLHAEVTPRHIHTSGVLLWGNSVWNPPLLIPSAVEGAVGGRPGPDSVYARGRADSHTPPAPGVCTLL